MSEQVTIEGMPAHVSWSSLDQYLSCPKKWQLGRLLRVEQRPMWAGIGGSAVHKASEDVDHALLRMTVIDNTPESEDNGTTTTTEEGAA